MKRWTHTLPALVLVGAFAVLIWPRSRAPGEVVLPAEPDVLVESFPETVTLRLVAKRLIAYGVILIIMMIVRPDGLVTRDQLRRIRWPKGQVRHA